MFCLQILDEGLLQRRRCVDSEQDRHFGLTAMINSLQYLRAIAAVAVVISHVGAHTFRLFDIPKGAFSFGAIGVDVFFILSGFIMMMVTERKEHSAGEFIRRRFIRIVPVYWAAVLFYLLWDATVLRLGISWDAATLLSSIVIWGTKAGSAVVGVAWTLRFEFAFYACFALGLWISHAYRAQLSGFFLLLVIAALKYYHGDHALILQSRNWSGGWYEFLFGMVLFSVWHKNAMFQPRMTLSPAASGVLIFGMTAGTLAFLGMFNTIGPLMPTVHEKQLFWGLPALLVFAIWLFVFSSYQASGPLEKALRHIGDASYSLYLVHMPVASTLAYVPWLQTFWKTLGMPTYLFASTVICILAGSLFYRFVEVPLLRLLGHGRRKKPSGSVPAPA